MGLPKGSGVEAKLRAFFAANPDEELTYSDMLTKFECSRRRLEDAIRELKQDGEFESIHVIRVARGLLR